MSDLTTCTSFTGNIVVAADGPQDIQLDGVTSVSGNIDIENVAKLRSLTSTSLEAVSSFTLNSLPALSTLTFPALKNFSSLKWYNLPSLEQCKIATGAIDGEIQEISIFNTSLKSLDWLTWPIGAALNITSNSNLQSFGIPYSSINANSAYTLTSNPSLASVDVSSLTGIYGGLEISGNAVKTLDFSKLQTIGGFVQLSGDYTNVSMPVLSGINGALSVESTEDITALCSNLAQKRLAGHYDCTPNAQKSASNPTATTSSGAPTATATTPPTPNENSSKSSISNAVKIAIGIATLIITLLFLTAAFFFFRRRSRAKVREIEPSSHRSSSADPFAKSKSAEANAFELEESDYSSNPTSPKELEAPGIRLELANGRTRQEMPAGVMPHELEAWHGRCEMHSPAMSTGSVNSITPLVRHELPA